MSAFIKKLQAARERLNERIKGADPEVQRCFIGLVLVSMITFTELCG